MTAGPDANQPSREGPDRLDAALWTFVLGLCTYFVVVYLTLGALRFGYPYALEWLEGTTVDHVLRVVSGQPLYVAPSLDFVPFIYTPVYYWVSAAASVVLGPGFLPLRAVSYAASIGCLILIFVFVRRESADRRAGFVAVGVFAATFQLSGAWLDSGRMDTLLLFLILLSVESMRRHDTVAGHVVAGLVMATAYFTKQVALIAALPLCVQAIAMGRGPRRLAFSGTLFASIAVGILVADASSDGWFGFYTLGVPLAHFDPNPEGESQILPRMLVRFWTGDLLGALPVASALSAAFVVLALRRGGREDGVFFLALAAGLLGASWSQRLHLGGFHNVLIPAHALIALATGMAIPAIRESLPPNGSRPAARWLMPAILVALAGQLLALAYDPRDELPGDADRIAAEQVVDLMRAAPGPLLSPSHGYLPTLAGKAPSAHSVAIHDVLRAGGPVSEVLRDEIERALDDGRYGVIVTPLVGFPEALTRNYVRRVSAPADASVTYPRGASVARSRDVYVLRATSD